jgi:outer membrane lipoprotein-sorting protein
LWLAGCAPLRSTSAIQRDEALLSARLGSKETLRARAVIKMSVNGGKETRAKAALLVKRPDKVRVELFGPFGQVVAVMVSNADGLSILSDKENGLFPHSEESPFNFPPEELADFIMGTALEGYIAKRDKYGNIEELRSDGGEGDGHTVILKDFQLTEDVYFPFSIYVEDKFGSLLVSYSSIELNHELKDALFINPDEGTP